jgi:DNA-binding transcriptional regulator YiaG
MYHYTESGLRNVWLVNGYTMHDTHFGPAVSFQDLDGLTVAICTALTKKPGPLTGGELRYLRSGGMLLSQPALGKLMGTDGQSVARWEKTGRVPKWADKLVRLLYIAHADGNVPIRRAMERTRIVERLTGQRIVVEEARGRWVPRFDDEVQPA